MLKKNYTPYVIDIGSQTLRFGVAGEDMPRKMIPPFMAETIDRSGIPIFCSVAGRTVYVYGNDSFGSKAISLMSGYNIRDTELFSRLLSYAADSSVMNSQKHPYIVAAHPQLLKKNQRITQSIENTFHAKKLYVLTQLFVIYWPLEEMQV